MNSDKTQQQGRLVASSKVGLRGTVALIAASCALAVLFKIAPPRDVAAGVFFLTGIVAIAKACRSREPQQKLIHWVLGLFLLGCAALWSLLL